MNLITAKQIRDYKGRIIDVREPAEFAGERLPRAELAPLSKLANAARAWDHGEPLLLMCRSGMRSKQAYDQLEAAGFSKLTMLEGGIEACKRAGVEVIRVRKTIPIIRQVMMTAGSLLLIGLLLGSRYPSFHIIDWVVACGLVFAGVTGYCPMAKLLELMPWNRVPSPGQAVQSGSCCGSATMKQQI